MIAILQTAAQTVTPQQTIENLFTLSALATLAGATGAVYVICSTAQSVFNFNPKWLALAVSILISFIGAFSTVSEPSAAKYFIALLNGCLIYTTATGANAIVARRPPDPVGPTTAGSRPEIYQPIKRTFTTSWSN